MRVLFVDHEAHRNTHSADFFIDILREAFDVDLHYYDRYYHCDIPEEKIAKADVVVFWEFLSDRFSLGIPGKRCVFVPMYDNEWGSKWQWRRIAKSGMRVISFCNAVTRHARACGVKGILEVHFAFNPDDYADMAGDPRKVAFWERGQITLNHVMQLLDSTDVDKLTLFRRPEPNLSFEPVSPESAQACHVEIKGGGFIPADEYRELQRESGVYIAPRWKEGIGMTVLEQMAMGKCVIAHDDATMNEYIEDGKTGILRNFHGKLGRISRVEIETVRANVREAASVHYRRWLGDRSAIAPFVAGVASAMSVGSFADRLRYLAFLAEGCWQRVSEKIVR